MDLDVHYMSRALELAERGRFTSRPNPRVGCVLVKAGQVIGEGWHQYAGGAHAETMALAEAGSEAAGSTCYVTLEPCCHQGRTPPCVESLLQAQVARVVAAMPDPNAQVNGQGLAQLRAAGVRVEVEVERARAEQLNRGFCKRMRQGLPYVVVKTAASLDGRTALASGISQWISSPEARKDVHRMRAQSGAVVTGIGTIVADDPLLTVRDFPLDPLVEQPLRVVADSRLRFPLAAKMLSQAGATCIATTVADPASAAPLQAGGAEVVVVAGDDARVDLHAMLQMLAQRGINDVLVEAGPVLSGALLSAGLVDEVLLYLAPKLIGSDGLGMFNLGSFSGLAQCPQLEILEVSSMGPDLRVIARLNG